MSTPANTDKLYQAVKQIIDESRNAVYRAANTAMVQAYWNIGRMIVEEEQSGKERAEYGEALLDQLSVKLTKEYGKGFSNRNLRHIRQFYLVFPNWNAVRSELSWTHYRILLKVENATARVYYMQESAAQSWSTRDLERQISTQYYERALSSGPNKVAPIPMKPGEVEKARPSDIIKDPYVLEFLNLSRNQKVSEGKLEDGLMEQLKEFLLELGKGFSFVGRQYKISAESEHFFVDLVFYNYILKCFVLIDLKVGSLTHENIGQMDFYVRYFEDQVKVEGDNPTIGLILCTEKNHAIAKYSLLSESKQIFASKYKTYLPTEEELQREIERGRQQIELEKKLGE